MPLNIFIREAKKHDLLTLVEYNRALAKESEKLQLDLDTLRLGVQNAIERTDCYYFVAVVEGNPVGQTMITTEWSDWRNGIIWWMQSVYVQPDFRKQGVFHSIFRYIEAIANKNPTVKALRLYVTKNNHTGRKTYQNIGMNNSGYLVYEKNLPSSP